jgi:predicted nucleic acid binding AN1-type Zn finger protein
LSSETITPTIPGLTTSVQTDLIATDQMTTLTVQTPTPSLSNNLQYSTNNIYDFNESQAVTNTSSLTATPLFDIYSVATMNISTVVTAFPTSMSDSSYYMQTMPMFSTSLLNWNTTDIWSHLDQSLTFMPQSTIYSENTQAIVSTEQSVMINPTPSSEYVALVYSTNLSLSEQLDLSSSEILTIYSSIDTSKTAILPTAIFTSALDISSTDVHTEYATNTPFLTTVQPMHLLTTLTETVTSSPPYSPNISSTPELSPTHQYETVSPTIAWPDSTTHVNDNTTDVYNYTESPGKMIVSDLFCMICAYFSSWHLA